MGVGFGLGAQRSAARRKYSLGEIERVGMQVCKAKGR